MAFRVIGFVLLLLCQGALAATYRLFEASGIASPQYNEIMRKVDRGEVGTGDEFEFSDGKRFAVKRVLGSGNVNYIFDIGNHEVLRIPKRSGDFQSADGPIPYADFINEYLAGAKALARYGVPIPKVDFARSRKGEYLVSEKVEVKFDLEQFQKLLARHPSDPSLKRAEADLIKFAQTTARFTEIGDLHDGNLVYTEHGWLLLDFTSWHGLYKGTGLAQHASFRFALPQGDHRNLFAEIGWDLPIRLRRDINDAIDNSRRSLATPIKVFTDSCRAIFYKATADLSSY